MSDLHTIIKTKNVVKEFRDELEEFAVANGLSITNITGWTEARIMVMAVNNKMCCCDSERKCPCKKGVQEAYENSEHMCKCKVLERK